MHSVLAIIVNYNGERVLAECIESLSRSQGRGSEFDLLIVALDNASIDGSREKLDRLGKDKPELRVIHSESNLGFSAGCNLAARQYPGDYLFFINYDAFVRPESLRNLLNDAVRTGAAASAPKVTNSADPDTIDSAGLGLYWDAASRGIGVGRHSTLYNRPRRGCIASGCACLVKREVFLRLGGYDADFFLYGEDVDFGLRLLQQGYKTSYCPQAEVRHAYSEALGGLNPKKLYYVERNHFWYLIKNFPIWYIALICPWLMLYRFAYMLLVAYPRMRGSIGTFSSEGKGEGFVSIAVYAGALLKAFYDGFRGIPRTFRKRKSMSTRQMIAVLRENHLSPTEMFGLQR